MTIDRDFLLDLLAKASDSPRLRMNYDLRTSDRDNSQRMLNALLPGTEVPVHRHPNSTETVILLLGSLDEIIYDEYGNEMERHRLSADSGPALCIVPAGAWHTVQVREPSVIFEAKDGRYGEDGSVSR